MHSKSLILFALSASAVIATPFHNKRGPHRGHFDLHKGTGRLRATGTGGSNANGTAPITSTITVTVTDFTADATSVVNFGNVVEQSTCTETSVVTETSTNLVTVTATPSVAAKVDAGVNPGAFYGQSSKSRNGFGQSSAAFSQQSGAASQSYNAPSATSSSGAATSGVAPPSGSSGGKRGISFNDAKLVSAFGSAVSWAYNWADSNSATMNGVEFVPMMWGKQSVAGFANKVGNAKHVLSFNEPDLAEQSDIDASTAASLHKQVMEPLRGKVLIGSPAVTNGVQNPDGSPMGTAYLEAFFAACGQNCPVDFVTYHWYGGADNFLDFQRYTNAVIDVARKNGVSKVWCTEFAPSGSTDAQAEFMSSAVSFLDGNTAVERYAAFMASEGTLLSSGKLNTAGSAYTSSS